MIENKRFKNINKEDILTLKFIADKMNSKRNK